MSGESDRDHSRKLAEDEMRQLRSDNGLFVTMVDRTRMPMLVSNPRLPGNPVIYANHSFVALTGHARADLLGKSYRFLEGPRTELAQFEGALEERFHGFPEICLYRKDGSEFWASMMIGPVMGKDGRISQFFLSFLDLTHKRQSERRGFLLDELNHRVKNSLATVQSIVSQTLRSANVERRIRDLVDGRILALGRAHESVARAGPDGASLRDVIEQVLQPHRDGDAPGRLSVEGGDVKLNAKVAMALGMMFHELIANAVKYGALSTDGNIDITWWIETTPLGDWISLKWQESGGPTVSPPDRKGFGSRLIRQGLAQELNAEVRLDFDPTGVVCRIRLPIPRE